MLSNRAITLFVIGLIVLGVGIRAYRDLSRPDAWAYWKDQFGSPSLTSSLTTVNQLSGSGRPVRALIAWRASLILRARS